MQRKIHWVSFFQYFNVLLPLFVPYLKQQGLSIAEVYWLQTAYGITVVLSMIPLGQLSDMLGMKRGLLLGCLLLGLASSLLLVCKSFESFLLYEILLALAMSLMSVNSLGLIYESEQTKEQRQTAKAIGIKNGMQFLAEALASLLCTVVFFLSFQATISVHIVLMWLPFILVLSSQIESRAHKSERVQLKQTLQRLIRENPYLTLIGLNLIFVNVTGMLLAWSYQHFWEELGIATHNFPLLWMGLNLVAGMASWKAYQMEEKWGANVLLISSGFFSLLGIGGMAWVSQTWASFLPLSFSLTLGFSHVVLAAAFNHKVTSSMRASANAIIHLGTFLLFSLLAPWIGKSLQVQGVARSYQFFAWGYGLCFVVLTVPLVVRNRRFKLSRD